MQEARPGFWVPDRTSWLWLFKGGGESHAGLDRVEACIAACGDRLGVAIDGGAFVGSWTIRLAASFERVVAFEPITENFECLERNVTCLPGVVDKVDLVRCALSNRVGPMGRKRPDLKAYSQRVRHLSRKVDTAWCEFNGVTLDSTEVKDVDLIKLDVEGHEYEALLGAEGTINEFKPVVMIEEKHDPDRRASALLKKWGMVCTWSKSYDFLFTWPVED